MRADFTYVCVRARGNERNGRRCVPPLSNYCENYRPRVAVQANETGVGAPRETSRKAIADDHNHKLSATNGYGIGINRESYDYFSYAVCKNCVALRFT